MNGPAVGPLIACLFTRELSRHTRPSTCQGTSSRSQVLLRRLIAYVLAIIISFNRLEDGFHLLGLLFPLLLGHLGLATEKLLVWFAITTSQTIPEGSELSVVIVEVEVMHRVASGAIDDGAVGDVLAIVNHDRPEIDECEEKNVREFLERKHEREDVVRNALRPAVDRMEGMRGIGSGHDPFVVWFVESLVDKGMVQPPVNPVNEEVGKGDEEGELQNAVVWEGLVSDRVIEFGISSDLGHEKRHGQQGHDGQRSHCLGDLKANLILEVFGVLKCGLIEDDNVRQGCTDEVNEETKNPGY